VGAVLVTCRARASFCDHGEAVAGLPAAVEAEHLYRDEGTGFSMVSP